MKIQTTLLILVTGIIYTQSIAQCTGNIPVFLGNDTSFCVGQTLTLNAGNHNSYVWDNNTTAATRTVSAPGTYYVRVGELSSNLITNGDFEQGNTGFTTAYVVGSGGSFGPVSNPGTYLISTSPSLAHNNFTSCTDHTANPGVNMMVVNGASTPNTNVWCQTVATQPNTDYQFSTWITNALNDANVAQLQFNINGSSVGPIFSTTALGCTWGQFFQIWNSGLNNSAQICIVNQNTGGGGNDFVLDDISFGPICYGTDTIVVGNYPIPVITASANDTVCAGEQGTISATSVTAGLSYTWNPGNINASTLNVSPLVTTTYTVTGTSAQGCVSAPLTRKVVVFTQPTASIFINGNDTLCNFQSSILNGSSTVSNSSLVWSSSSNTTSVEVVNPMVGSSNYTLTVTSPQGCIDDTTITLFKLAPLQVAISGNAAICDDETSILTATGNYPGMNFTWSINNQNTSSITVNAANSGTISVSADYFGCPSVSNSVNLIVKPKPLVFAPEDQLICPGETFTVNATSDQANSTYTWIPSIEDGQYQTFTMVASQYIYVQAELDGCLSEIDSFFVSTDAACMLEVPNVFTPNGDNDNDFFGLINSNGIASLTCVITNRWGNVVAEFDKATFQWNGKDRNSGGEIANGVYFYTINAVTKANEEIKASGFVQLYR